MSCRVAAGDSVGSNPTGTSTEPHGDSRTARKPRNAVAASLSATPSVLHRPAPGNAVLGIVGLDLLDALPAEDVGAAVVSLVMSQFDPGGTIGALMTVAALADFQSASREGDPSAAEALSAARRRIVQAAVDLPSRTLRAVLRLVLAHASVENALYLPEPGQLARSLICELKPVTERHLGLVEELSNRKGAPVVEARQKAADVLAALQWLGRQGVGSGVPPLAAARLHTESSASPLRPRTRHHPCAPTGTAFDELGLTIWLLRAAHIILRVPRSDNPTVPQKRS